MKRRDFIKWNAAAAAMMAAPTVLSQMDLEKIQSVFRPPRAKSIVVLYMVGGPSQVELFEYKPELYKFDKKTMKDWASHTSGKMGQRMITKPITNFKQYGQCGQWVSDLFPNIATIVDELTMIKSFTAKEDNHAPAQLEFCTGASFPGQPYAGAWLNYALNRPLGELPQSFLLTDPHGAFRIGDLAFTTHPLPNANAMFKFADRQKVHQILKMANTDQDFLKLFQALNEKSYLASEYEGIMQRRMEDFRLIYSMRDSILNVLDLNELPASEEKLYGLEDPMCRSFGEQLIIARRLVEKGVPFVKVYCGNDDEDKNWDNHINIDDILGMAHKVDKPIAGFIKDLKQRGLLEDTVVMWGGEFGRGPTTDEPRGNGRPHNTEAGTIWLAGAGIKKGFSIGETDELSLKTVSSRVEMGDVWATLFHLMGVDHQKISYPSPSGREMRLTRTYHRVLHEILT